MDEMGHLPCPVVCADEPVPVEDKVQESHEALANERGQKSPSPSPRSRSKPRKERLPTKAVEKAKAAKKDPKARRRDGVRKERQKGRSSAS